MALIEIDGLPNLKMVEFSMAKCESIPGVFLEFSRCEGEMFGQRRGKWEVNGTDFPQNWQLLRKNMRFVQGGGPQL